MVPADLKLDREFDAVVIGGSAGAIDALAELLPALPKSERTAVIVVVHLPANQKSLMVEIFKPRCTPVVREAEDKSPVELGTIWFAPPDYHLLIESDRTFALSIDAHVCFSRPAIDVLFESAAAVYGERLLGIVLTGASRDGAHGAKAIRERGGTVIVQDPEEAATGIMPKAAIEEANPQWVTSLAGITRALADSLSKKRESREQG
jgi:two-component system chemotaxis response regulator CheB